VSNSVPFAVMTMSSSRSKPNSPETKVVGGGLSPMHDVEVPQHGAGGLAVDPGAKCRTGSPPPNIRLKGLGMAKCRSG
jgi:hypothetical protein